MHFQKGNDEGFEQKLVQKEYEQTKKLENNGNKKIISKANENRPRSVGRPREALSNSEQANTSFSTFNSLKDKLDRQRQSFYGEFF